MHSNPYQFSESPGEPVPARRVGLRSRIVWFVLGFIVSWAVWSAITFSRGRSQDYTQSLPAELRELLPGDDWRKKAIGRRVGRFIVIAAPGSKASADISTAKPNQFPGVIFDDEDSDGIVDSVHIADASHRTFSFNVADGRFKSYNYTNDVFAKDQITFRDGDMDGQFDGRFGPGTKGHAIMIDSQWRDVIEEGGNRYVDLNGRRVRLELMDGVLKVAPQEREE
jgi:hypothetical protein